MKQFSLLLPLLFLLQSCSVYHSGTASIEEAVAAHNRVKVVAEDGTKYKFRKLETSEGKLLGITRLNSSTAEKIAGMPADIEGKRLKVDLSEMSIEKIKIRNNTLSTMINVGVPVLVAGTALFLYVVNSLVDSMKGKFGADLMLTPPANSLLLKENLN